MVKQVDKQSSIAQEEIFGSVLSVFSFNDEEEAIRLANDSNYGLAAYAATKDMARAHRLGQRIRAGNLTIYGTDKPRGEHSATCSRWPQGIGFDAGESRGLFDFFKSDYVCVNVYEFGTDWKPVFFRRNMV